MPQDLLDIFLLKRGSLLNLDGDRADVDLMKIQGFFMSSLCCIAISSRRAASRIWWVHAQAAVLPVLLNLLVGYSICI